MKNERINRSRRTGTCTIGLLLFFITCAAIPVRAAAGTISSNPATGGYGDWTLWAILAIAAASLIALLFGFWAILRRRKRKKSDAS